jgi:RimJ/RimL family protein N-acetyltransferase
MAAPPERLDAGLLVLRRLRPDDADAIAAAVAASMDHLRPWMPWATPDSADPRTQRVRVAESDEMWAQGTDFIYSIVDTDGALAGEIGLHRRLDDGGIEIGYWIAEQQTRRGLGTAAAAALTEVALRLPGVTRVEIHCDEANVASSAIPRKLGYRLDRVSSYPPEAPGESGRRQIWVREPAAPETST